MLIYWIQSSGGDVAGLVDVDWRTLAVESVKVKKDLDRDLYIGKRELFWYE